MKIAVIGAGIFGVSVALKLDATGYQVDLIERYGDILQAASGINQYRLHRGYHYPRSVETAKSALSAEPLFRAEYGPAVIDSENHFYGLAKENSKVNAEQFKNFCAECGLEYEEIKLNLLNQTEFQLVVRVKEALFDPLILREICRDKLSRSKVNLLLNTEAEQDIFEHYDLVVNCTYANLNSLLKIEEGQTKNYQFELCEKPVLKMPATFKDVSLVVIDGPFMCLDPYDQTGYHVMGNVVHAIHATNVGLAPSIPEIYKPLLNRGIVPAAEIDTISKIKDFITSAAPFIPSVTQIEHIGSMFTIRTVLPNLDKTDSRPTLVESVGDKLINVFSGKIGNSVVAAEQVLALVEAKF